MVDKSTAKERKRFYDYRMIVAKSIQRRPKSKQFALRTSPKKRPKTPPPKPKKTKNIKLNKDLEDIKNYMIERLTILKDLIAPQPKDVKRASLEFLDSIADQLKTFAF
jgi:hypothetical protein